MRNKIYIPKIPFVIFELVEVNFGEQRANQADYRANQIDTIYMAIKPTNYQFRTQGRSGISQTDENVFVDVYPNAPEKVTLSGTFGDLPKYVAGTFMDGYSRMRQFEERVIQKKLEIEASRRAEITEKEIADRIAEGKSFIVINYYDFLWNKFGSITLNDWSLNGNASQSSRMVNYSITFTITGELVPVTSSGWTFGNSDDPLLQTLNKFVGLKGQEALDKTFNMALYQASNHILKYLGVADLVLATAGLIGNCVDMAKAYIPASKNEYQKVTDLGNKTVNTLWGSGGY